MLGFYFLNLFKNTILKAVFEFLVQQANCSSKRLLSINNVFSFEILFPCKKTLFILSSKKHEQNFSEKGVLTLVESSYSYVKV